MAREARALLPLPQSQSLNTSFSPSVTYSDNVNKYNFSVLLWQLSQHKYEYVASVVRTKEAAQ